MIPLQDHSTGRVADPLQVHLEDRTLTEEIALLADLIVAATASDGPLRQPALDVVLGLGAG